MGDGYREKAEETTGAAKRKVGESTGDEELKSEGRQEEIKAEAKQAGDKAAQSARETAEEVRDRARRAFRK